MNLLFYLINWLNEIFSPLSWLVKNPSNFTEVINHFWFTRPEFFLILISIIPITVSVLKKTGRCRYLLYLYLPSFFAWLVGLQSISNIENGTFTTTLSLSITHIGVGIVLGVFLSYLSLNFSQTLTFFRTLRSKENSV